MKNLVFYFLYAISLCAAASNFKCQVFNNRTKSLEKYCDNFNGTVPANCSGLTWVEPIQLKIGGCDRGNVSQIVTKFNNNLTDIDISHSGHKSLDWLDLKLNQLKKLNASHNQIVDIKKLLDKAPKVTEIDLSYNKLRRIHSNSLGKLNELVIIDLSNNNLSVVQSWDHSPKLESIDLSNNHLKEIPVFSSNKQLKTLNLEGNPIENFDCIAIARKTSLSIYLTWKNVTSFSGNSDCEGKQFKVFVENIQHEGVLAAPIREKRSLNCRANSFKNLHNFTAGRGSFSRREVLNIVRCFGSSLWEIDLAGNFIGKLNTATFNRFAELTHLSLSDTSLKDFDFSLIQNQKSLWMLDISHNHLKDVSNISLLEMFPHLNDLNIAENQLEKTQEIINHLTSAVEKLNLAGNYLGRLNVTTFDRFAELKILNISNTNLSISSTNLFKPLNLTSLDISRNDLKNVNFAILATTLTKLDEFFAAHCQIKNASNVIRYLGSSIKKLDLSGNFVGILNGQTFEKLVNLEYLKLSKAKILSFGANIFQQQTKLQTLDLSYNKLKRIEIGPLAKSLQHLNVDGNDLTKIANLTQSKFTALKSLAITKNQFSCQYLKELKGEWKRKGFKFIGNSWTQKHGRNCHSNPKNIIFVIVIIAAALIIGASYFVYKQFLEKKS